MARRIATAALFVIIACLPYYADALLRWDGEIGVPLGLAYLALFPLTGFVVGRWWVVLLLVLIPLLLYPLGQDPEDSDWWHYAWEFIWGPLLIGGPALLTGYGLRCGSRVLERPGKEETGDVCNAHEPCR